MLRFERGDAPALWKQTHNEGVNLVYLTDDVKEQELLSSDDQKYSHLKEDLHVLIEVEAPKAEAHGRLAAGIAEVQKFLVPVSIWEWIASI